MLQLGAWPAYGRVRASRSVRVRRLSRGPPPPTLLPVAALPFDVDVSLALVPGAVQALVACTRWLPSTPGADAHLAKQSLVLGVVVLAATCVLVPD